MPSNHEESLVISVVILRRAIGFIGFFLPFSLVVLSGFGIQPSISDYYHLPGILVRDVFVGAMCAIGVFMCSYKGFDIRDFWVTTLAGVFAILTALFPVEPLVNPTPSDQTRTWFHLAFAGIFLGSLAFLCLFLFTKTNPKKKPTLQKIYRNRVYYVCGWLMVGSLLLLVIRLCLPQGMKDALAPLHPVFWLETVAVMAFGFSWLIKGETLLGDKKP